MIDTKRLMEGFLGGRPTSGASPWGAGTTPAGGGSLGDMLGGLLGRGGSGGLGGLLGGAGGGGGVGGGGLGGLLGGVRPPFGGAVGSAAAGGLLGSLLGGGRRGGGGLLKVGGMAVLGLLAHRAYEQYRASQATAPTSAPASPTAPATASPAASLGGYARPAALAAPAPEEFGQAEAPAGDGHPFALVLVRAMAAAARADGHLDATERERIFAEVERLGLGPDEKGFVFAALDGPVDPAAIAAGATTDAQRAELYMASRLVAEPDTASERAYLDALAHHLRLDPALRRSLDDQAAEASRLSEGAA